MSRVTFSPVRRSLISLVLFCVTLSACVPRLPGPAATSARVPSSTLSRCPAILFARERDLWRTDLDGGVVEQLTEGRKLHWRPGADDWWVEFLSRPVQVSPDGRWITTLPQYERILVEVTTHALVRLPGPGAAIVDWSPDSRYLAYARRRGSDDGLYVYDVQQGQATELLDLPIADAGAGIENVVWSPDGRFIGFSCCFTIPTDVYTGTLVGEIRQIEVATRQMETVGETQSHVGASSPLCWTPEGQPTTDRDRGVRCSYERSLPTAVSPDGTKRASLGPSPPGDPWTGGSRLTVGEAATGEVLWPLEIPETVQTLTWSPDGEYLLLDDRLDRSPIWRIKSDGSGELETIVDDGFLLGVVAEWCLPWASSGAAGQ